MHRSGAASRREGFTLVELLLAVTLGVLATAVLASLLHGLLSAVRIQATQTEGPEAARAALRQMSRELASAFAPPDPDEVPFALQHSHEPGKPSMSLSFYATVPYLPGTFAAYGIEHITYEVVHSGPGDQRELRRISVPSAGPRSGAPTTNILLRGAFRLSAAIPTQGNLEEEWPPPAMETAELPPAVRLTLDGLAPSSTAYTMETLVQAAHGISSPIERPNAGEEAPAR
ncbi:MAG: GspJ family type II secretion system protein [Verrucomicrobiota bacterium]|nr:GspJ family type II secretion system protein [Verrucomicrobiota bacterium]